MDILIRNLLDLPSDAAALRHTYLRVLYPLLAHTQLKRPPYYKYEEIRKLLAVLAGAQPIHDYGEDDPGSGLWSHFEEADETTKRLVSRCRTVPWLENPETTESEIQAALDHGTATSPVDVVSGEKVPPVPPIPRKLRKRNASRTASGYLIPQLDSARESALSVLEVAAQREKPGVITPSRKASLRGAASKKQKPLPPRTRRSTWGRRARDVEHSAEEHSTGDVIASTRTEDQKSSGPPPEVGTTILVSPKDDHCSPPLTKQPPPQAPKTRRWRGIRHRKDEGGGSSATDNLDSSSDHPILLSIPSPPTLSGTNPTSSPQASVSEALYTVQAEAMDDISEALERAALDPEPAAAAQEGKLGGKMEKVEQKTAVLAPPSLAPPRGVPGPRFELERSPFLGEDDEDD